MISINYTDNKKLKLKIFGIAGALLTLVIPFFLMLHNDHDHLQTDQSLCPFKMLTGFPCPGCGITKSLVYLYEGDVAKSFSYHLFGPFAFVFCIVVVITLTAELISGKEYFNSIFYSKKIAYFLGIILVSYHLGRLVYFVKDHTSEEIIKESIWR
ncbi:DUF2752 domain-containing protein [Flavobacterium macacae]|uniref:DUF2752 domain-containing protein n=1 Tax=Flavobacterium macacae TaxID=2488993 RepID=A0A3P3WFQ9_9FLAO|nr:DUF2752 domain-containing protein [Flavobacterium macacae]